MVLQKQKAELASCTIKFVLPRGGILILLNYPPRGQLFSKSLKQRASHTLHLTQLKHLLLLATCSLTCSLF